VFLHDASWSVLIEGGRYLAAGLIGYLRAESLRSAGEDVATVTR
jgi:hypothetical protein